MTAAWKEVGYLRTQESAMLEAEQMLEKTIHQSGDTETSNQLHHHHGWLQSHDAESQQLTRETDEFERSRDRDDRAVWFPTLNRRHTMKLRTRKQ